MSPYTAITRMATISETYGIERARTDGRFKRDREAWTTGVFALAFSKLKEEERWIEIETVEATPDNRLHLIDQSSGRNVIWTHNIEVVDWQENVDDIMEVIKKKCKRAYPSHYFLLVNARHSGKILDFDLVVEEIKKMRSPFLEVWVVAFIGRDEMKVVRVAPAVFSIDMKKSEFEKASKQKPFVQRENRGTGTEFRDLGLTYLPIPRGD
jgi:hypothetical protein